jgi:diguanylate cyclase (GGDEF)-like protein
MSATTESIAKPREGPVGSLSLETVLGHCNLAKVLVEESLLDLSLVNLFLTDDSVDDGCGPAGNIGRDRARMTETRMKEAFRVLAVASRTLAGEIKARRMQDHQFAAVQEQEAAGRHRMLHDVLTGMPNRILFNDRLEHGLARSMRHALPLAVMFIDLDGFKDVNDRYGHDMGDAVLKVLADRLQDHTRSEDTASRYGGDEFLYLLADPGGDQSIVAIAERMIRLIQEPCEVSSHGTDISISLDASIGISVYPRDGVTVDTLIKSADSAMYRAKQRKCGYSFAL